MGHDRIQNLCLLPDLGLRRSPVWRMGPPKAGMATTPESGSHVTIIICMDENCGARVTHAGV
jgi:hypothetical protein